MPPDSERLLEELTNAHGPTGFEGPVRELMRRELGPIAGSIETDGLGSLIARLDGSAERPRVMLAAHMDELGLMVRRLTSEGFVKFQPLGGWLDQALINQRWTVLTREGPVPGVTGIKTVHVMKPEARKKLFEREEMFLDVGATSLEDAAERLALRPGDPIVPDSRFTPLSGGALYLAKAWDDRVGLGVMVQAMLRATRRRAPTPTPSSPSPPCRRRSACAARRPAATTWSPTSASTSSRAWRATTPASRPTRRRSG